MAIHWRKLTSRHTVKLAGSKGSKFYTTGSGELIYWDGREASEAQAFLKRKSRERSRRRK